MLALFISNNDHMINRDEMTPEQLQEHDLNVAIQMQEAMDDVYERERHRLMEEERTVTSDEIEIAQPEHLPGAILSEDPAPIAFVDSNGTNIITDANAANDNTVLYDPIDFDTTEFGDGTAIHVKKKKAKVKTAPTPKPAKEPFTTKILRIAKMALGEENASLDRNASGGGSSLEDMLILKWDYIDIRNRSSMHHDIKDMYIALPYHSTGFRNSIHGFRGRLSHVEFISGYRHSHLYQNSNFINPFCTGSDGINDLWADLHMSSFNDEDFEIKLEGFIHQLTSFLSYESLEGVPYFRMENINTGNVSSNISSRAVTSNVNEIMRNINVSDIELCMDFNNGTAKVIETEHLHTVMAMYSDKHQKRLPNGTYVGLDTNDLATVNGFYIENERGHFNFKGKNHKIFVEPHFKQEENNGSKEQERRYAHQQIVQQVIGRIEGKGEEILERFCLENSIPVQTEEEGTNHNWRTVNARHYVRVSETTIQGVVFGPLLATE